MTSVVLTSKRKSDWKRLKSSGRVKPCKKTRDRRAVVKLLDANARAACFERDGYKCIRCGKAEGIQWAHVITRSRTSLRWLLDNGMTMCGGCHMFFWHKHPLEAAAWFQAKFPDRYHHLMVKLQSVGDKLTVAKLREMLEAQ